MTFAPFLNHSGNAAGKETRSLIIPKGNKLLPPGEYGLIELYCDAPDCDCRRVIFWIVRSDHPDKILATINFGWETPEFYRQWMGSKGGEYELAGATLEPLGPQSELSENLLKLCKHALEDKIYIERIKNHYDFFRNSLKSNITPIQTFAESNDKIRVCLTSKELDLIKEETFIDDELVDPIDTLNGKFYFNWSVDDIDSVLGYIAEASNHIENKETIKKLDRLYDKIEKSVNIKRTKKKPMRDKKPFESVPDWAQEDAKLRTTPYTEQELDLLTKGTVESIEDLDVWKNLVEMVGIGDATQTIRRALQEQQPGDKKSRH